MMPTWWVRVNDYLHSITYLNALFILDLTSLLKAMKQRADSAE